jgi:hypothetical protein
LNDAARLRNAGLSLLGAVLGGVVGHLVFVWALRHGFYAMIAPGALLGVGSGLLARERSMPRAIFCGVMALGLGLFSEWRVRPFVTDPSLAYFLAHISSLQPVPLLMIALGGVFGGWLALGRD